MGRRPSQTTIAHLLLAATVFVWGATFSLVKVALVDASPLLFNFLRMAVATAALLLVNRRQLRGMLRPATLVSGFIVGFFLAAGYQFQTTGLARTTPTKSAMLTSLVVLFVPLCSIIPRLRPVGTKAPGVSTGVGAMLAFAGLFLLTTPIGTRVVDAFREIAPGDLLTLACAVAFAGHLLALAHFAPRMKTSHLSTLQIAFATLFMGLTLPFAATPYLHVSLRLLLAIGITGILGTAMAFTVQSWAQQHLRASHVAVLLTLEPVFALLTSAVFLGERFSTRSLWGIGLILCGIVALEIEAKGPIPSPLA